MTSGSRLLLAAGAATVAAGALAFAAFRRDVRSARRRIETGRQFIETEHGPIEFAEAGDGPAVLVIHGAGGGFDQGLDLGRGFLGDRYRIIAPSRFGYLGTAVPADASAEAQADAHMRLLDTLNVGAVPVIGVSAGGPSALQFCLRHPERCTALVLVVPLAYTPKHEGAEGPSPFFRRVLDTVASSDFVFWSALKVARPALVKTILGTPLDVYRTATAADRRNVDEVLRTILPMSRRAAGIENDGVIGSTLKRYPLEQIRVPTLVITTADCGYGTYENSLYTVGQIRHAKLIAFSSGGHLLMGHEAEVRAEITDFVRKSLEVKTALAG